MNYLILFVMLVSISGFHFSEMERAVQPSKLRTALSNVKWATEQATRIPGLDVIYNAGFVMVNHTKQIYQLCNYLRKLVAKNCQRNIKTGYTCGFSIPSAQGKPFIVSLQIEVPEEEDLNNEETYKEEPENEKVDNIKLGVNGEPKISIRGLLNYKEEFKKIVSPRTVEIPCMYPPFIPGFKVCLSLKNFMYVAETQSINVCLKMNGLVTYLTAYKILEIDFNCVQLNYLTKSIIAPNPGAKVKVFFPIPEFVRRPSLESLKEDQRVKNEPNVSKNDPLKGYRPDPERLKPDGGPSKTIVKKDLIRS